MTNALKYRIQENKQKAIIAALLGSKERIVPSTYEEEGDMGFKVLPEEEGGKYIFYHGTNRSIGDRFRVSPYLSSHPAYSISYADDLELYNVPVGDGK